QLKRPPVRRDRTVALPIGPLLASLTVLIGMAAVIVAQFLHYIGDQSAWHAPQKRYAVMMTVLAVLAGGIGTAGLLLRRRRMVIVGAVLAIGLVSEALWFRSPASLTSGLYRLGPGHWIGFAGAVMMAGALVVSGSRSFGTSPLRAAPLPARLAIGAVGPVLMIVSEFLHFAPGVSVWDVPPTRYAAAVAIVSGLTLIVVAGGVLLRRRWLLIASAVLPLLLIGQVFPVWFSSYSGAQIGFWLAVVADVIAVAAGTY